MNKRIDYLIMYLESFKNSDPDIWELCDIKVFANNCTDGTKEWCDTNKIWCENVSLPGLYSIWNYGASITNNEFIVFSASDFILAPGFWKVIGDSLVNNGRFYHLTGTCIDNGISYPHPDIIERRWYNRDCGDNWKDFDYKKFLETVKEISTDKEITENETSYCPFLTTREHYNFLNGFNTALGDYPTDIDHDFVRRGKEAGRECAIVDKAFFYHFGKKSLLRRDGQNLSYNWKDLGEL